MKQTNSSLLLLALLSATTSHTQPPLEELIRGAWCAGSKSAFHEQFSLDVQDGLRVFESWMHEKPALYGTWELRGRSLVIRGCQAAARSRPPLLPPVSSLSWRRSV